MSTIIEPSSATEHLLAPSACPTPAEATAAYQRVRAFSLKLIETLEPEDCVIQSMPDVSPIRWHLAHTTWFFETFILRQVNPSFVSPNEQFEYLFNSYYNTVGKQFPRDRRGLLSRPTLAEVLSYRQAIDSEMQQFLEQSESSHAWERVAATIQLGIQHEQQHQELMLTDIKHVFSCNPLLPAFQQTNPAISQFREESDIATSRLNFLPVCGGIHAIGHEGDGFCYDNETPRHQALIQDCELSDRLITNGEYLQFMLDGGYENPAYWLSSGWATVETQNWNSPLYWFQRDGEWFEFTLLGPKRLGLAQPVCHVSYFEADAYARWSNARLPTEMEWEVFASRYQETTGAYGTFADQLAWHPQACNRVENEVLPSQVFGDCWQWTASQYVGYPGYKPVAGAIGEYNGKFMCNQFVLRGGSVATSRDHIRTTYRNFFPPDARWQFSGIRIAKL